MRKYRKPFRDNDIPVSKWTILLLLVSTSTIYFAICSNITNVILKQYELTFNAMRQAPILQSQTDVLDLLSRFENRESISPSYSYFNGRELLQTDENDSRRKKAEEEASDLIIKFKRRIPRRDFSGNEVSAEFQPTSFEYYQSLIIMAIPGFALAFLSCCCGGCFLIWRFCCGCFGGRNPKPEGYTVKQRFIPKQLLIAFALMIVVAAAFGWSGNTRVSNGIQDFFGVILDTSSTVITAVDRIVLRLSSLRSADFAEVQESITSMRDGLSDFREVADTAKNTVTQYDRYRLAAINLGYAISAISAGLGILGALFNRGILCLLLAIFGIFSMAFLWISFGFHLPTSVLLADMCVALDDFLEETANNSTATASGAEGLSDIIRCLSDDSYNPALDLSYNGLNDTLASLNNITVTCCNISYTAENVTLLDVSIFPEDDQEDIEIFLNDYIIYLDIVDELEKLANCEFVRTAFQGMRFAICVTTLKGIDLIMGTQGLMGLVFIPTFIFAIIGWKRFGHPRVKNYQDYGNVGTAAYDDNQFPNDNEYYEYDEERDNLGKGKSNQ